jgi:DNA-binding response OmpR family regulator
VIYVDDDLDDLSIVKEEFDKYPKIEFITFSESCKFLKYIIEEREHKRLPSLIMLDINMPVLNGKEILTVLRSFKEFKTIPIALYTTSSSPSDLTFAKNLNAQFITKPLFVSHLSATVQELIRNVLLENF